MGIETKQLRLSVTLVDDASEHIKKLRGEMENLTGGAVTLGLGKTGQHAEGLAQQFTPLVSNLAQGGSIAKTVMDVMPTLARSLGAVGAVATAAVLNIDRYRRSLADYGSAVRELNIAAASLKKVDQEWKRAGMTPPQMESNRTAIAQAMGDVQNQGSNLAKSLRGVMHTGGEAQRKAVESLIEAMRAGDYEGTVNAIKESGDALYDETLKNTGSEVRAAETRNRFYGIIGVVEFSRPMKKIVKATKEEIEDLDKQIKQWAAFNASVRRAGVAVEKITGQVGLMTEKYGPVIETYKSMLDAAQKTASGLKRGREFREQQESGPTVRDIQRQKREMRQRGRVQKQSYSGGNGSFGGAPIVLASYQDSTDKIQDDVRETVILTNQFRTLNNLLRGAGGGGASAIRASLGMPPGGGGGGGSYGPSGTGTRGTGGGTTGPSTTQPSTPPGIPGMPGVQPGDTGVAAMIRGGAPRANLLASLQPTTPGGTRPLAVPSMVGGAVGGVAGMIGTGAVGGTGAVPAGAGPRTDVPGLRMPELPRGVPYGGGGRTVPAATTGGGYGAAGPTSASGKGTTGVTSIRDLERDPQAQAAIARFSEAFPKVTDAKTQLYSLVAGESNFGRDMGKRNYRGYFQLGGSEAYKDMGLTGDQFSALPFHEQLDAYTKWAKKNDPNGKKITNLGLFNAASAMKWQGMSDDTVIYQAGSAAANANAPTWGKHSNAGGNITIGGIKRYYARNDPETNRAVAAAGGAVAPSAAVVAQQPGDGEVKMRGGSMGIRPELWDVVKEASKSLPPGYYAKVESGAGPRPRGGEHPKTNAADVRIYGPDGKAVGGMDPGGVKGWRGRGSNPEGWYQNPKTFRLYESFAQAAKQAQVQKYPKSEGFAWGGYFLNRYSGSGPMPYGTADLMHMQWGGPMGSGNWKEGATGPIRKWLNEEGGESYGLGKGPAVSSASSAASIAEPVKNAEPSFSFKDAMAKKPFIDATKLDRALGGEVKKKVDGDGDIEVDVKGPNGTKVTAKGGGIFKRASVNRVKEPISEKKEEPKAEPKVERTASRTDEE